MKLYSVFYKFYYKDSKEPEIYFIGVFTKDTDFDKLFTDEINFWEDSIANYKKYEGSYSSLYTLSDCTYEFFKVPVAVNQPLIKENSIGMEDL